MPAASREAVAWAAGSLNDELWRCPPTSTKYSYPSAFSQPSQLEGSCWRSGRLGEGIELVRIRDWKK